MANLVTTKIVDLLPISLQGDASVMAAATALDSELTAVTTAIEECLLLPRLDELAEDVIDLLAWQWHVDSYDPGFPIAKKRNLVLQSIAWHRRKGTPGLVQDLVSAIYSSGVVTEWFEYGGTPYHFRVQTTGVISSDEIYTQLRAAIEVAKNVRSWLDGVYIVREWSGIWYMGFAMHQAKTLTIYPAAFDNQTGSMGLFFRGALHAGKILTVGVAE
jgi:phage tail P2-like protein